MKKCVIIYNPHSGKLKKDYFLQTFYDILRKHGYETEVKYTKKKERCNRNSKKIRRC